jgi:hypothetical protein
MNYDNLLDIRQGLVNQVSGRATMLARAVPAPNGHDDAVIGNGHDRRPWSNGHDQQPSTLKVDQRSVDAELAAAARVSISQVRAARCLIRSGAENLAVAAMLQLLPISTALRGALPPKANARYARWRDIAAICGGGQ